MSEFIMKVRNSLLSPFGDHWNTMWAQVGFVQPSIALPRRLQDRITLAKKVNDFLAANPSREIPSQGITAAQGVLIRKAVIDAQTPLQQANMDLKTASTDLNTAQAALVKSIRYVIKILTGGLAKDDPAWEIFGLNMPATKATPGAPTGLQATVLGTQVMLQCDVTPLATRYRFPHEDRGRRDGLQAGQELEGALGDLEGYHAGRNAGDHRAGGERRLARCRLRSDHAHCAARSSGRDSLRCRTRAARGDRA